MCRILAAFATQPSQGEKSVKADKPAKKPAQSKAFCMNLFRGSLVPEQAFPYPDVLNEDQRETLEMLVSPTEKFFNEVNDAAKNDKLERVPDDIMDALKEMGAFGLQVRILHLILSNGSNFYKFHVKFGHLFTGSNRVKWCWTE